MKHLDLFSGIGGFAIAVDEVFGESEHIFCDNDKFCQQVLRKHWPKSKIYGDIRLITDTKSDGTQGGIHEQGQNSKLGKVDILTGGFPCQPFSQAGKRRGTEDERHLWPEMLRVIRLAKPEWVIAENVRGLLTQEGGLPFEQVCLDLEASDYEVQPFIIPAVAVNAPHRRDRVWFIAHRTSERPDNRKCDRKERHLLRNENGDAEKDKSKWNGRECGVGEVGADASDTESGQSGKSSERKGRENFERRSWERSWLEVATELCGMDDGLSPELYIFRGMIYTDEYGQEIQCKNPKAIPTLTKSIWEEMRKVWSDWQTASASSKNGRQGFYYFVRSLPHKGTQEIRDWYVGEREEEKELCDLWERVCSEPFKDAQVLFPEVFERVGKIKRNEKVGKEKDFAGWSKARHRVERLKSLGNSIVPQVAVEIIKSLTYQ